jgi:hypothetical protein
MSADDLGTHRDIMASSNLGPADGRFAFDDDAGGRNRPKQYVARPTGTLDRQQSLKFSLKIHD